MKNIIILTGIIYIFNYNSLIAQITERVYILKITDRNKGYERVVEEWGFSPNKKGDRLLLDTSTCKPIVNQFGSLDGLLCCEMKDLTIYNSIMVNKLYDSLGKNYSESDSKMFKKFHSNFNKVYISNDSEITVEVWKGNIEACYCRQDNNKKLYYPSSVILIKKVGKREKMKRKEIKLLSSQIKVYLSLSSIKYSFPQINSTVN